MQRDDPAGSVFFLVDGGNRGRRWTTVQRVYSMWSLLNWTSLLFFLQSASEGRGGRYCHRVRVDEQKN
jgi:hypothetical protein